MILLYTFEGEDYPFKVEETTDDLANFLKRHFDKFDVVLKGKSSDIWNLLLDLDILDKILKDDRFEEYLKEYYKDTAYEDFLSYKEVMKDDEVVEEAVSTLGRKRDAKGRFASIKPAYDDKDYDRVQISAYNTLKNKKPYAVIYAYIKDKSKVLLNPPLVKNSQAEVDEFVNSFKKGKEATKVVVEVFYLSQLDKIERALKERGLISEAKSSKPLKLYKYNGRAFNFEHELPIQDEYYVYAVSEKQALNNLRARIAKELDRDIKRFLVTLEDDKLKEVKPEEQVEDEEHFEKKFCDKHRKPVPLTDGGYCPICDDGVDESEYFAESFEDDGKIKFITKEEFLDKVKDGFNDFEKEVEKSRGVISDVTFNPYFEGKSLFNVKINFTIAYPPFTGTDDYFSNYKLNYINNITHSVKYFERPLYKSMVERVYVRNTPLKLNNHIYTSSMSDYDYKRVNDYTYNCTFTLIVRDDGEYREYLDESSKMKNEKESFKVDNASILDLISEFEKEYKYYFNNFYFGGDTLEILIKGDWKHDHAFVDFALPRFAKEKYNINLIQKDTIEHDEDDYLGSDNYVATHVFKVV